MGGELSAESGKNNASRATITRTSSLKDITLSDENANNIEVQNNIPSKPVKRSSTFSGGGRPQIIRRVKKKSKQASSADEHREAFISDDTCIDVTDGIDMGAYHNTGKLRTGSTSTEENLFIPTKRTFETKASPTTSHKSLELPDSKQRIPVFDEQNLDERSTVAESNSPTVSCKSSQSAGSSPCRRRFSESSLEEETIRRHSRSKSESEKEETNGSKENVITDDDCKGKTSNVTRIKSSEKRSKLARSKSLGSPPGLDALLEEGDDGESKALRPTINTHTPVAHTKSLERMDRRSSESHKRREQHVKRAAHFSAMLKEAKLKENRVRSYNELSPYGQEVMANISSPQKTPPPKPRKHLRQNQFFDSWIKEQSERINTLAQALRGDEFKMNELRSSFRGRELKTSISQKLPARPKSDNLPRRQIPARTTTTKYLSSDTEDELDSRVCSGEYDYTPKAKSFGDDATIKKQLSDTFLLLNSYFENSKKDLPQYERSTDSSAHSSVAYHVSDNVFFPESDSNEKNPDVSTAVGIDNSLKFESQI